MAKWFVRTTLVISVNLGTAHEAVALLSDWGLHISTKEILTISTCLVRPQKLEKDHRRAVSF